jgi:hypothetical protein
MGPQGLLHVVVVLDVAGVVQVADAEQPLHFEHALLGERRGLVLFVDSVIPGSVFLAGLPAFDHLAAHQFGDDAVDFVVLVGGLFGRAGNDERRAGFVDKDGIDFVDDGVVVAALRAILQAELHVVAEVVEAEFVVGAVSDVGAVSVLAFAVVEIVDDHAHAQSQGFVEAAHPLGIAFGQVIVHRDHVHAPAFQRVEIGRQGGHQSLSFTGLHFGDFAAVKHHAAHQLNVEMAHFEDAPAGLADHGESFQQKIVEGGALGQPFPELDGFGGQGGIGKLAHGRFQIVDGSHFGLHALDLALCLGAEDFRQEGVDNHELGLVTGGSPQFSF